MYSIIICITWITRTRAGKERFIKFDLMHYDSDASNPYQRSITSIFLLLEGFKHYLLVLFQSLNECSSHLISVLVFMVVVPGMQITSSMTPSTNCRGSSSWPAENKIK